MFNKAKGWPVNEDGNRNFTYSLFGGVFECMFL